MTTEPTITIKAPIDFSRGLRTRTGTDLYARPAANLALGVAVDHLRRRENVEPWTEVDERLAANNRTRAAAHPIAAQLLPLADKLGATLDPTAFDSDWTAAAQLIAEQNRIDPMPAYVGSGQDDDDDTCRHGRTFSQTCPGCEL